MPRGQEMSLIFAMNIVVLWDINSCQLANSYVLPKGSTIL